MVRSRNWPDLWWQISKIRDIQVVGTYDLMKPWRFETNRISGVATAQPQSQKPVFDFDLTWWPDLWWPGVEIFTQGVKFNCEQVLKKWRRCAPPFFRYLRKTGGEGIFCPPPSSARVNQTSEICMQPAGTSSFVSTLKHVRLIYFHRLNITSILESKNYLFVSFATIKHFCNTKAKCFPIQSVFCAAYIFSPHELIIPFSSWHNSCENFAAQWTLTPSN